MHLVNTKLCEIVDKTRNMLYVISTVLHTSVNSGVQDINNADAAKHAIEWPGRYSRCTIKHKA